MAKTRTLSSSKGLLGHWPCHPTVPAHHLNQEGWGHHIFVYMWYHGVPFLSSMLNIYIYICMYVCMREYIYIYIHTYIHIYIYIYIWGGETGEAAVHRYSALMCQCCHVGLAQRWFRVVCAHQRRPDMDVEAMSQQLFLAATGYSSWSLEVPMGLSPTLLERPHQTRYPACHFAAPQPVGGPDRLPDHFGVLVRQGTSHGTRWNAQGKYPTAVHSTVWMYEVWASFQIQRWWGCSYVQEAWSHFLNSLFIWPYQMWSLHEGIFHFGKLHNHLRTSTRCRISLQSQLHRCSPQEGHGSTVNRQLDHTHDGILPPTISLGPSLPAPGLRAVEDFDVEIYGELTEVLLSEGTIADKRSQLRDTARSRAISWSQFVQTVESLKDNACEHDLHGFDLTHEVFLEVVSSLLDPDTWPWFQDSSRAEKPERSVLDMEWQCDNARIGPAAHTQETPQCFGVHRFILHAFSGRRRKGDFQFFLDAIADEHPGIVIHTLSVDIILDSQWGDVSDEKVQNFWISAAQRGWVVAFLGGPPCETWSRAREHSLQEKARQGPRVIRSAQHPWGFECLTLREIRQILVGNQLMWFCLMMMTVLYDAGSCGALEHPARPPKPTSASIWNTSILQLLLQLPGFHLWEFAQGLLGAISAKPTMILALNLPTLGQQLRRWRVVDELPKTVSIGQGTDGKFNTMVLKEYPPGLCGALATSFCQRLGGLPVDDSVEIPGEFFRTCASMSVKMYSEVIGPDYAGGASRRWPEFAAWSRREPLCTISKNMGRVLKFGTSKTMSFNTNLVFMMTWMICGTTISGNLAANIHIYL